MLLKEKRSQAMLIVFASLTLPFAKLGLFIPHSTTITLL